MSTKASIIMRAVGTVGAVMALVGGVTYAALTSNTAALTNSTISTGTASLKVYSFQDNAYKTSAPGFVITNLVPGVGDTEHFYLSNDGSVPLNITANIPNLPAAPASGYGFSGFDNLTVSITGEKCGQTINTTMASLNSGQVPLPCNPLAAGAAGDSNTSGTAGNYDIHFDFNSVAITGSSAGVGPFDIVFSGTE